MGDGIVFALAGENSARPRRPAASVAGAVVPDVIEVSYVRRDLGEMAVSDEIFPTPLDRPCNPAQAEIALGRFQFS